MFAILFALALSSLFTKPASPPIAYDKAVAMVNEDKIEKATVYPEEVMLVPKADTEGVKGELRVYRLSGVEDEPLVKALLDKKVALETKSDTTPFWVQALFWVALLLLINGIFIWMLRRMSQAQGAGPLGFLKSRTRVYDKSKQEAVRFSDVAGVDEAKDELVEIVDFLKRPERYRSLGGRIPRGVLLIGPPGTGKTLLARAVAGEALVPFFSLNASEFVEMFVGLGAARVRDLFDQAKKQAPCIVFIDEIDAVGRSRGGMSSFVSHDEREQTLQQLLAELDGFDERSAVIVMAATNRPEVLDPALLRPGRFDRQVIVERPDLKGREAILEVHARKVQLSSDVDLRAVARRTPGMAGADLANVVNEAALAAARRGGTSIAQADFAEALDRVQLGLRRKGTIMSPAERRRVAFHESGHALVALSLPNADQLDRVSIIARSIGALGTTIQVQRDERYIMTETELEARVTVMLGGRAAEDLVFDEVSTGAHDDLGRATTIVREMVTRFGMSRRLGLPALTRPVGAPMLGQLNEERLCGETTASEVDFEIRERMEELYAKAKHLLTVRRAGLEAAAEALIARETLTGEEMARIVANAMAKEPTRGSSAA